MCKPATHWASCAATSWCPSSFQGYVELDHEGLCAWQCARPDGLRAPGYATAPAAPVAGVAHAIPPDRWPPEALPTVMAIRDYWLGLAFGVVG